MDPVRHTIHPEAKVLSEREGLVEYVASDETVDHDNEVLRAKGARFDRFQKNALLLNNHRYDSPEDVLGKVVDYKVRGDKLIETAKFAIEVPENRLARLSFDMVRGGYMPAVSVGLEREEVVTPSDRMAYKAQLEEMGMKSLRPKQITTRWQQLELSVCTLPVNPNALATGKALTDAIKAGVVSHDDLGWLYERCPGLEESIDREGSRSRIFSFPSETKSEQSNESKHMKARQNLLSEFRSLTAPTRKAFDDVEMARRGDSESDIARAIYQLGKALHRERRISFDDPVALMLSDRETFLNWSVTAKAIFRMPLREEETSRLKELNAVKALNPGTFDGGTGASLFNIPVAENFQNILPIETGWEPFYVEIPGPYTKLLSETGKPTGYVLSADRVGPDTYNVDASTLGKSISPLSATFITLIEMSEAVRQDNDVYFTTAFVRLVKSGLDQTIGACAFVGDGSDNTTYGKQTGIFQDGTITSVSANAGNTAVEKLERNDFIGAIGALAAGALQRAATCRWFTNPVFLPSLLKLRDGPGNTYLLKGPSETESEWRLVEYPVTWAAQAPSVNAAGSKIAAFAESSCYSVALRERFEFSTSNRVKFNQALLQVRALARGLCQTREATGIATLKLAAA